MKLKSNKKLITALVVVVCILLTSAVAFLVFDASRPHISFTFAYQDGSSSTASFGQSDSMYTAVKTPISSVTATFPSDTNDVSVLITSYGQTVYSEPSGRLSSTSSTFTASELISNLPTQGNYVMTVTSHGITITWAFIYNNLGIQGITPP